MTKTTPAEPDAEPDTGPDTGRQRTVAELEAENADLREQLAAAKLSTASHPNTRPVPHQPSFGISEGTRQELEDRGTATDPFTGKALTKADLPA